MSYNENIWTVKNSSNNKFCLTNILLFNYSQFLEIRCKCKKYKQSIKKYKLNKEKNINIIYIYIYIKFHI